ncbi:cytochrome P450 [Xylariaceae sp. FL0016]|nr:cytochrome P450 [Xylariaceae sp. FL0016]
MTASDSHIPGISTSQEEEKNNGENVVPIPQPPKHWFTGNLSEMDPSFPSSSMWRLASIYGEIYKLDLVMRSIVIISSYDLINECMDENRFEKCPTGPLVELRALLGDGLFTAFEGEKNWWKAHRILMPVFGPLAIRKMFPDMQDLISQMVLRMDRMGPDNEVEASDDFTRLAFDTIGLCGFGYRFNSFYRDEIHPFATEMADVLIESGKRANRTALENRARLFSAEESRKNIADMWKLCDDLVAERKRNPKPESKDLLSAMLSTKDPETGEGLSDENIRYNMVTFLVAGHETSSGTLSFLFYHLLKNPETYHKAQAEIDEVVGDDVLRLEHLPKLKYIEACIREALRVRGPISAFVLKPKEDTMIGNKYPLVAGQPIQVNLSGLHHDPKVWGEDADVFRPERLMDGRFEKLPPNAWKPFGNGHRACIGRFLAEQEMTMATAMILQRFQVSMANPSYDLHLKSTLTVKPDHFKIKFRRRPGQSAMLGIPGAMPATDAQKDAKDHHEGGRKSQQFGQPLLILYGSNAGTCKYLAEDLQTAANDRGFTATVKTMDEATEHLPTDCPVAVITPSYEGKPADNARKFVAWLEACKSDCMKDVTYAVFGAGNSEWTTTFHRIPKLVDERMAELGAKRAVKAQFVDVKEDLIGPFEDWRDELLASISGDEMQPIETGTSELEVIVQQPEQVDILAGEKSYTGIVRENKQIASADVGSAKRHMEIGLPEGVSYETGDYLVVLPTNTAATIRRAVFRFGLNMDDLVTVKGTNKEFLTSRGPLTAIDILGTRVELGTPVSKRQVEAIAKTADGNEQNELLSVASSDHTYKKEILEKRKSVLDLLEDYPSAKLSFGAFLDMLRPLTPRQYSISSSPLATHPSPCAGEGPLVATLTYDVHEAPARSGHNRVFQGVASTYLANRPPGSKIRCFVRRSNTGFHLPADPAVPTILVAAGTGMAPMRGFIQERAMIAEAGNKKLAPGLFYFGCRDADKDFLYSKELRKWEELGAVRLRPAFSRHGPGGCKRYTHERMWEEREEIRELFRNGARVFVCGSASKLARSTADVSKRIWLECNPGKGEAEAEEWLQGIREVRYVSDVFD